MTWFDIKYSGQEYVENLTGGDEKTLVGLGFHGYATQAQAKAHPDSANAVQMLIAANVLAGHPTGGVNTPNPPGPTTVAGAGAVAAGQPLDWLSNIANFFSKLTQANTWIRIGEVVAGMILLGIGVNALFHGAPMKTVTDVAGKIPKVVPV